MEHHPSVSVLGSHSRSFWTEERKCTVERASEKSDGRVAAAVWRQDHGDQTSRRREQVIFERRGRSVVVAEGPAEYHNCRIVRIGEQSLALDLETWRDALKKVEGGLGDVILERRDPLESPRGSNALHPIAVRTALLFEDCLQGSTVLLRRSHFSPDDSPFRREEAEGHWTWSGLDSNQHAANLADALVHSRRHAGCRAQRDAADIYESQCAAVHSQLKAYGVEADMHDAASLLHFRGPRSPEQGRRLLQILQDAATAISTDFIRPGAEGGCEGEFWADFVQGKEKALGDLMVVHRRRFERLLAEISQVITDDKSPRHHRSRTPPR